MSQQKLAVGAFTGTLGAILLQAATGSVAVSVLGGLGIAFAGASLADDSAPEAPAP